MLDRPFFYIYRHPRPSGNVLSRTRTHPSGVCAGAVRLRCCLRPGSQLEKSRVEARGGHLAVGARAPQWPPPARWRVGRFLLSKVPVFTLNTYLRHCIGMYRACIGMYPGARPKSLCDDTIPVDTREIHHDTTYRTPAPSPPDPIHRYTLDTIQIQRVLVLLHFRPTVKNTSC